MSVVIMVFQVLLGLAILIILHELGHYLAARAFGIKVEKFFLFFDAYGFKLFSFKRGDTEFGVGWLPLGGYVKIAGMIDESMDKEQMALPPKPDEFRSKPAWQRLIVMLSGVAVNIVLGVVIFWIITMKYGEPYIAMSEYTNGIVPGQALTEIGLKPGDKVIKIGSKTVVKNNDLYSTDLFYGNVTLNVQRGDQMVNVFVPSNFVDKMSKYGTRKDLFSPRLRTIVDSLVPKGRAALSGLAKKDEIVSVNGVITTFLDQFQQQLILNKGKNITLGVLRNAQLINVQVAADTSSKLGFGNQIPDFKIKRENYSILAALGIGSNRAFSVITDNAKAFSKIFKREISPRNLSGPVGVAKMFGSQFDWARFWLLTGVLSMALAFMNILPIPALDGGHALFLLVEIIKGKPLSVKFLETAQMVGFFIIIGLMVFTFGNDILKLIIK